MIAAQTADFDFRWFPLFFAGMWLGISSLLSVIGGWHALAKKYRCEEEVPGDLYWFVSMSVGRFFGGVNYGSCVFVRFNERGLALSILFPFRFCHPPLFIPWHAVSSCEPTKVWFRKATKIEIRDPDNCISFYGRVAKDLLAFYQAHQSAGLRKDTFFEAPS